ncbi:hypothetical protein FXO38_18146 [Capsicum annuum]|nr:hypothetical protein FXO38_18146 [Capsicum annuum]
MRPNFQLVRLSPTWKMAKVASGSLDKRIVSTEAGLAVLGHRFKTLESNVSALEAAALEGLDEVKADLSEQNKEHKGLTSLELKLTEALSALHEEFGSKLSEVMLGQSALQEEVADLKQQLEAARVGGNHGSVAYHDARIEAPKPNVFKGDRNAQDVENFIWQLKSYFEHVKIVDGASRIRIATMYFSDVAMLCAQFLVHWKGQSPEEASWEKYEDLWPFKEKVHKYLQLCGAAVVVKSGGGECDAPRHYPLNSSRFGHNFKRFEYISEPDGASTTSRDKAKVGASLGGQNTSSGQHLWGFGALTSWTETAQQKQVTRQGPFH